MKPRSELMQAALKRYVNYLLSRGTESAPVGLIMLDSSEAHVNHQFLEEINHETRCQFISLTEFNAHKKHHLPSVLVLDAHQEIPEFVSFAFEGILRASSFDGGVQ